MIAPTRRTVIGGLLAIAATPARVNPREEYARLLKRITGDDTNPAVAERRLRQELARLTARADALFARIGDRRGSTGERYSRLFRDPAYLYTDDDAGRDRAVADMRGRLAAIRPRLAEAFDPLPRAILDVDVRRLSLAEEAEGRGGFRDLPILPASKELDPRLRGETSAAGTTLAGATAKAGAQFRATPEPPPAPRAQAPTGAYVVDLRDIRRRPNWSLPSVVAHETLPGHMIQLPLEQAAPHPLSPDEARGFPEGWATWAEVLAARSGWLGNDPRVLLGHHHWLLFRVNRALADLALHWHDRAPVAVRAAWVANQGEPVYFATFDTEMARIPREPASRVGEALFWLAIQDCAPARTGAALRRFHAALLRHGRIRTDMMRDIA